MAVFAKIRYLAVALITIKNLEALFALKAWRRIVDHFEYRIKAP